LHTLQFERSGSRLMAVFEQTSDQGYYTAEAMGKGAISASAAFAVNLAPEESSFERISEDQLHGILPNARWVDASAEARQLLGSLGEEREIARPLIFLLFAIIALEFIVATLSGRRNPENPTLAQQVCRLNPVTWIGHMTGAGSGSA